MSVSSARSNRRGNPAATPPTAAVVKLKAGSQEIINRYNQLLESPGRKIGSWLESLGDSMFGPLDLANLDPNLRISAVFKPRDEPEINALRATRGRGDKEFTVDDLPEFQTYIRFEIDPYDVEAVDSPEALEVEILANQANVVDSVSIGGVIVHRGAILSPKKIVGSPITADMSQGFFNHPDEGGIGIGEIQSSEIYQADGKGTWFVDVEQGWSLPHSEIAGKYHGDPNTGVPYMISGVNRDWIWSRGAGTNGDFAPFGWHGLATLGLILAKKGNGGLTGIAPESFGFLAAEWEKLEHTLYTENTAQAIKAAADLLDPGDVILIEGQQYFEKYKRNLPVEADPAIFAAIKYATDQNITVVEPAGNNFPKGVNLDAYMHPNNLPHLAEDSGAILVAAGNNNVANPAFSSRPESNYGTRVNCFADGDMIWSLDPEGRKGNTVTNYYRVPRGGTSTAAAIIAGVALVLQGIQRAQTPPKVISAVEMRNLLSDTNNGEEIVPKDPAKNFGVMPNLIKMEAAKGGTLTGLGNLP